MKGPSIGQAVHVIAPSGAALDARVRDAGDSSLILRLDGEELAQRDPLGLLAHSPVNVEFTSARGVCRMPGMASPAGGGSIVRVDATGRTELIQRRDFVRVEAFVPVTYEPLGPEGWTVTAHTLDVSGGGFQIASAEALRIGDMMRFTLDLGEGEQPQSAVAAATRDAGEGVLGMRFVEMAESERQRLIRWVFARERLARQIARHA